MDIFSFIKSHVNILDVVGRYTMLKKAGQYFKGVCPFHAERTASFTVSPGKNIFYCFGCSAGGDVISFIAKSESCTQYEAAQFIIEEYKLEVPSDVVQQIVGDQEKKKSYFQLCELVARWCCEKLQRSVKAKNYIKQRGFAPIILERFSIGYFPGGSRAVTSLIDYLKEYNFLLQDLLDAKIVIEGKRSPYSPFEDRIIFPIYDHHGRCTGFGGRIFLPNDSRAKYYNSHENEFFNKGSLLFGFDKAKKAISRKESVLLVEGYTDCLALAGVDHLNVVATLGTSCTAEHLKQLSRFAKELYVIFDADQAGINAVLRLTQLCWEVDLDLFVIKLPIGQDPASYISSGNSMDDALKKSEDIFSFYIDTLGSEFQLKGLQDRLELIHQFIQTIGRIQDPLKKDFLIYKASSVFEVPSQTLRREMSRVNRPFERAKSLEKKDIIHSKFEDVMVLEKKLFSAILNNVNSLAQEDEAYLMQYLPKSLQQVLAKVLAVKGKEYVSFERMYEVLDEEEKQWVSEVFLKWPCEDSDTLYTLMRQFAKKQWKKTVNDMATKLRYAQKNKNAQEIATLLKEFQQLKSKLLNRGLI